MTVKAVSFLAVIAAVLMLVASPAAAASIDTSGGDSKGSVRGSCEFLTTVVSPTGLQAVTGIDGSSTSSSPLNPVVSTSVSCRVVENGESAGLTLLGPRWTAAVPIGVRGLSTANICVTAVAFLLDGHTISAQERCGLFY